MNRGGRGERGGEDRGPLFRAKAQSHKGWGASVARCAVMTRQNRMDGIAERRRDRPSGCPPCGQAVSLRGCGAPSRPPFELHDVPFGYRINWILRRSTFGVGRKASVSPRLRGRDEACRFPRCRCAQPGASRLTLPLGVLAASGNRCLNALRGCHDGCWGCVGGRLRPCVLGCGLAESRHAAAVPGDIFKQVRVGRARRKLIWRDAAR
jgi:hypothetical protein